MGQAAEVIVEELVLALVGLSVQGRLWQAAYFLLSWNSE